MRRRQWRSQQNLTNMLEGMRGTGPFNNPPMRRVGVIRLAIARE
jgi:hypothetical protein